MDRMFEQAQKLYADEMAWWTQQNIKATEEAMANGEKLFKTGSDLVTEAFKAQTAFAETVTKHLTELGNKQMDVWTKAFQRA